MNPNTKKLISVALTTFLGAVVGYLVPLISGGAVPPEAQWNGLAFSALVAGVSAVIHLFQAPPSFPPAPPQGPYRDNAAPPACPLSGPRSLMAALHFRRWATVALACFFCAACCHCSWFQSHPQVLTDASAVAAEIEKDALAGESIEQILLDPLLAVDVATVIEVLWTSLDSRVIGSKAGIEARAARLAMGLDGGR